MAVGTRCDAKLLQLGPQMGLQGVDLGRPRPRSRFFSVHSCLDLHAKSNYNMGISMRFRSLVVGLLVIGSLFAANAQSGDGDKDLKALQGTWRLVVGEI